MQLNRKGMGKQSLALLIEWESHLLYRASHTPWSMSMIYMYLVPSLSGASRDWAAPYGLLLLLLSAEFSFFGSNGMRKWQTAHLPGLVISCGATLRLRLFCDICVS